MRYPLENWKKLKRGYKFGGKTFYSDFHLGTDYIVPERTSVFAPRKCEIVKVGMFEQGGKTVHARMSAGKFGRVVMRFMHLSKYAKMGKYEKGDIIGYTGNTGKLTRGPHLHIDISRKKVDIKNISNFIDPEKFFARQGDKKL